MALAIVALGLAACSRNAPAPATPPRAIILATTTSTQDSGLLDVLVPEFRKATGVPVKVVAVGTGQALEMGRRGDADALLVHAPKSEEAFMKEGFGADRRLVMHNDFIIVGPSEDPAGVKRATDSVAAMTAIASSKSAFISRGDDSGTHKMELQLWKDAGVTAKGQAWYAEAGQGMGATLQIAGQRAAYTLSDRATFLAQRDRLSLVIVHEGDRRLLNVYHVITLDRTRFPKANHDGARAFADFLVSDRAQRLIGEFGKDHFGQPLFTPDAGKAEADVGGR